MISSYLDMSAIQVANLMLVKALSDLVDIIIHILYSGPLRESERPRPLLEFRLLGG